MLGNKNKANAKSWYLHVRYRFFNKFGKKILDQIHLGDYNIISRRGWLFMGKEYWYDKDYE